MSVEFYANCVRQFHQKNSVSPTQRMAINPLPEMGAIAGAALELSRRLERAMEKQEDMRWLRAHLILEEPAELVMALAQGDETKALDAAADTLYVLLGAVVTFDWPLDAAFAEVHNSNMSKTRRSDDPGRVRDKGLSYRAPDVEGILRAYRAGKLNRRRPMTVPEGMSALGREDQELVQALVDALTHSPETRRAAQEAVRPIMHSMEDVWKQQRGQATGQ